MVLLVLPVMLGFTDELAADGDDGTLAELALLVAGLDAVVFTELELLVF